MVVWDLCCFCFSPHRESTCYTCDLFCHSTAPIAAMICKWNEALLNVWERAHGFLGENVTSPSKRFVPARLVACLMSVPPLNASICPPADFVSPFVNVNFYPFCAYKFCHSTRGRQRWGLAGDSRIVYKERKYRFKSQVVPKSGVIV